MPGWFLDNTKYFTVCLGILAGFPLVRRYCKRFDLTNSVWMAVLLSLSFSAVSLISALLFAMLEQLLSGQSISVGSISTYGVYFICPILIALPARFLHWDIKRLLDLYALYAIPSLILMRVNCLIVGCCYGRPMGIANLTWPTRAAEMVFYAAMLVVLLRREKRSATAGTYFPLLLTSYGAFRFIAEWFRAGEGWLHMAHGWSVLAVIIGLGFYFELKRQGARRVRPGRS